ncbi:hypothetical protein P7H16_14025 [Paenibacillus larvae]|nr:hypothetical protein [Paenibacillus larvae]MDT2247812.1 hypothetical protein [Paenibacillus larvae]MDT2254990.1 hypothetical protein [Paenibacillus larvae]MDT2264145.1 hypothetical protein [Paenibacillus larvae]MDT2305164.1 hypothetical protein [Paenibacillus larvae]
MLFADGGRPPVIPNPCDSKGELQEELTAISEKAIKQKAQEKIRQEIYETYRKGMEK